jgi:thiamine-phosphate diphosphorylase
MVPRLHVVTDDDVLARSDFRALANALIRAHGDRVALHLRSPAGDVGRLHETAEAVARRAGRSGTPLLVNDRADVAMAMDAFGVQLGRRSIPVQAARSLLGEDRAIGYSAHGADEAASAVASGADFVLLGTIWETPSHPGREEQGLGLVRNAVARTAAPVLAIGGVTPDRAREARSAGAYGVAVVRGVWEAADPVAAAGMYLEAIEEAHE